MSAKVCIVLCAGPAGVWNQDPRPLLDSSQRHEIIDKRASIEDCIFRGVHYCLDCVKIQSLDIQGSVLETEHTLKLVLTSRI